MRICIVAANNIRYSPYIFFYKSILDGIGAEYELIFPNRNDLEDEWEGTFYSIEWDKSKHSAINYYQYSREIKKIITKNRYEKIIVLTSTIAVFLGGWLSHKYKNKYIIDIRDYTFENIFLYRLAERKVFSNALIRVVSSERFKSFLPEMKYEVCHNISFENHSRPQIWRKAEETIVIGYVGSVAYYENVKKLINLVNNDDRFCFYIYGEGPAQEQIKKYVSSVDNERVKYLGGYHPGQKAQIIESIDVLFNIYGNYSPLLRCALSNKLYDAMYYRKVVLNSPGTYMEEMTGICGFSIDLESSKDLSSVYSWYRALKSKDVIRYQDKMLQRFIDENQQTKELIANILIENK